MKKVILSDVDGTVVDLVSEWEKWYNIETGEKAEPRDITRYNVDSYMFPKVKNPLKFFDNPNIYDELTPIRYSLEKLTKLNDIGFDIYFITHTCSFSYHRVSKQNFIRKFFPFYKGLFFTRDRSLFPVKRSFLLDDWDVNIEKWAETGRKSYKIDWTNPEKSWKNFDISLAKV